MSEIFLCGDCGFLGEVSALSRKTYERGKDKLDLSVIIEKNGFACKCCPMCQSTTIYYKLPFLGTVSVPSAWMPPEESQAQLIGKVTTNIPDDQRVFWNNLRDKVEEETEAINEDILLEALNSTERVEVAEKPAKTTKKEKITINRTRNSKARYKCSCDTCKKHFESKVEGTVRCPDCLKAIVR